MRRCKLCAGRFDDCAVETYKVNMPPFSKVGGEKMELCAGCAELLELDDSDVILNGADGVKNDV